MRRQNHRVLLLLLPALIPALSGASCARQHLMVEVSGAVMHEKPRILKVAHVLRDLRANGGGLSVRVTLVGDPGLVASFDIAPDVADRRPMRETSPGTYTADFDWPATLFGGPFTVIGRLAHREAGEITLAAPEAIAIGLADDAAPPPDPLP
jgi:hypothetical protein